MDRASIIRPGYAGGGVIKRVVRRWHIAGVKTHQVWYNGANALLLVVKHDGRTAGFAHAQFQGTTRILGVERHAFQAVGTCHSEVTVVEKNDVRGGLPGDTLADRAVTGVIVDRLLVGMSTVMGASACMFVCHVISFSRW